MLNFLSSLFSQTQLRAARLPSPAAARDLYPPDPLPARARRPRHVAPCALCDQPARPGHRTCSEEHAAVLETFSF